MITLQRKSNDEHGTYGQYLNLPVSMDAFTLEPPKPVLPAGKYLLQYYYSPTFKCHIPRYVDLNNSRFAERCIAVHWGNISVDTNGCTLVGSGYAMIDCAVEWPNKPNKRDLGIVNGLVRSRDTWVKFVNSLYLGKIQHAKDGSEYFIGGTEIDVRD